MSSETLVATFNGRHVELQCEVESLADQLRTRIAHLMTGPIPGQPPVLSVTLAELEPSWIEVRDSTCRCERGSFEYVVYHARKWMTGAFVAAHPDLLWIHAAAAVLDASGILLVGPAGAGKSTLLVKLIDQGWSLLADVQQDSCRSDIRPCPWPSRPRSEPAARNSRTTRVSSSSSRRS